MANQARILLFHMNNDRQHSIEELCRSLSIKVTYIKPTSYLQSMGYLSGIQGFSKTVTSYTGADFEYEMLVFSGMDSDIIDSFLDAFKQTGLPPVSLKAIITPTNIFWTPIALYKELKREHLHFI